MGLRDRMKESLDEARADRDARGKRLAHLDAKNGSLALYQGRLEWKADGEREVVDLRLVDVEAVVDTAGQITRRATVTRFVATGGLGALAFKKKKDERELYLVVETSTGAAAVLEVDPKRGKDARKVAVQINAASRAARVGDDPVG
jgi:hypothetical protein